MEDNSQNIKSSPKMMIGTVQFGIPYGIANNQGQPSNEEVMAIMKHAHESGVDEYDTAAAYGESEKRLGYSFKELGITKNVSVYTKIKPLRAEISKCLLSIMLAGICKASTSPCLIHSFTE